MERDGLRKTFKYRLKSTPEQERALAMVLWRCRELYNAALQERRDAWRKCGVSVSFAGQSAQLPGVKEVRPSTGTSMRKSCRTCCTGWTRRSRRSSGEWRRAKRRGIHVSRAATATPASPIPQVGEHGGARLDNGFLVLSKIGRIAVRWSRPLEGTPKTVTVSREADGWYVAFSCAEVPRRPLPADRSGDGHRRGVEGVPGDGGGGGGRESASLPPGGAAAGTAQRRVSRRKQGSNRRKKAAVLLAKAHQTVKRQRADHHHTTALAMVRAYDTISHEAIRPANLSRRPAPLPDGNGGYVPNRATRKAGLNKSIRDAGWGGFRSILACKAACAGKRVEAVPPAFTSQDCSGCGARVPKGLRVRTHVCPSCGLVLDRDANAARNILRAGQARRGAVASAAVVN